MSFLWGTGDMVKSVFLNLELTQDLWAQSEKFGLVPPTRLYPVWDQSLSQIKAEVLWLVKYTCHNFFGDNDQLRRGVKHLPGEIQNGVVSLLRDMGCSELGLSFEFRLLDQKTSSRKILAGVVMGKMSTHFNGVDPSSLDDVPSIEDSFHFQAAKTRSLEGWTALPLGNW